MNPGLEMEWRVAMRPGTRRGRDPVSPEALVATAEASARARSLSSVLIRAEHPFPRAKRLFGYAKVRYCRLAKNTERLALLFGLGNLLAAQGQLRG